MQKYKMISIKIDNYVSLHQGVTTKEGEGINKEIIAAFNQNEKIELDFKDIKLTTTAFLNEAIGVLYKDYTSEELKKRLSFKNISQETAIRIKKVTNNAKLFYKNQDTFNEMVEDALYGN